MQARWRDAIEKKWEQVSESMCKKNKHLLDHTEKIDEDENGT